MKDRHHTPEAAIGPPEPPGDPEPLCEECGWTGDVLVAGLCAECWVEAEVCE